MKRMKISRRIKLFFSNFTGVVIFLLVAGAFVSFFTLAILAGLALVTVAVALSVYYFSRESGERFTFGIFGKRRTRITREGFFLALLALLLGVAAYNASLNLLYLVSFFLLAAIVVGGLAATTNLRGISVERIMPPNVCCGEEFPVFVKIHNRKRFLSSFAITVRDYLPEGLSLYPSSVFALTVSPDETATYSYAATCTRRGVFEIEALRLSTRFPFGLFDNFYVLSQPAELIVFPQLGTIQESMLAMSQELYGATRAQTFLRGYQEELHGLREFRPGDNPKHIHWKSTAKHRKEMVKEFESEKSRELNICLDTYVATGDEEGQRLLEKAISFVATYLSDLSGENFEIALCLFTPEYRLLRGRLDGALLMDILTTLAGVEPTDEKRLGDLYRASRGSLYPNGALVQVTINPHTQEGLAELPDNVSQVVPIDVGSSHFNSLFALEDILDQA